MRFRTGFALAAFAVAARGAAAQAPLTPTQQLAREIYKEVIELNTVNIGGSTTEAANAIARRFREAGFPESDIFLGGVQPNKHNVVVRFRGKGGPSAPKPPVIRYAAEGSITVSPAFGVTSRNALMSTT